MKTSKCMKMIWVFSFGLGLICPTFAGEKDCADIAIFKRHIDLTACDLEKQIGDQLSEVTDIKITKFRYKVVPNALYITKNTNYRLGALRFSGNHESGEINVQCRLWLWQYPFYMTADSCRSGNKRLVNMEFYFPLSIVKDDWNSETVIR